MCSEAPPDEKATLLPLVYASAPSLLVAALAVQISFGFGPVGAMDWWIALVLAAPAVLDWGIGRLGHRGRNSIRVITGVFLGIAVGRSLLLYFREPTNEIFWVQAALILTSALTFEGVRRLKLG